MHIKIKTPCELAVRIPEWVDPDESQSPRMRKEFRRTIANQTAGLAMAGIDVRRAGG